MYRIGLVLVSVLGVATAFGCEFNYAPISVHQFYRAEGWELPGATNFKPRAPVVLGALPHFRSIPGVVVQFLPHDENPYVITFPAQTFVLNGKQHRMKELHAEAGLERYLVNGRVIAYSYALTPVEAHREKGKWVVDAAAACEFTATFVDHTGDGVFRVLIQGPLMAGLIPSWAKNDKN